MAAGRLKIDIRRKKILELLAQNGQVTVTELSELLNATQTTIRTDLDTMAAENRLMRIPGGAIAVPAQPVQPPRRFRTFRTAIRCFSIPARPRCAWPKRSAPASAFAS